jgi:hypothetical protein
VSVNGQGGVLCEWCGQDPAEYELDDARICGACLLAEADAAEDPDDERTEP